MFAACREELSDPLAGFLVLVSRPCAVVDYDRT